MKSEKTSDNGFLSFFKKQKGLWKAGALLALGLILIVFGMWGADKDKSSENAATEEERIEQRLSDMCSALDGVGECRVMINYKAASNKYGSTDSGRVESVAVLCRGGGSEKVRKELTELITALFGIGANRVKIGELS